MPLQLVGLTTTQRLQLHQPALGDDVIPEGPWNIGAGSGTASRTEEDSRTSHQQQDADSLSESFISHPRKLQFQHDSFLRKACQSCGSRAEAQRQKCPFVPKCQVCTAPHVCLIKLGALILGYAKEQGLLVGQTASGKIKLLPQKLAWL